MHRWVCIAAGTDSLDWFLMAAVHPARYCLATLLPGHRGHAVAVSWRARTTHPEAKAALRLDPLETEAVGPRRGIRRVG
jgi:hypothetical protein